jgi:formate dehydrogenase assembly factor FdhD
MDCGRRAPYHRRMTWLRRITIGLVLAAACLLSVVIFAAVDAGSHSASDTLYGAVVPIGLVWLAALAVSVLTARAMRGS